MNEQFFMNEMSCNFNLRQPKGEKPTNIYLVVRLNRKQVKLTTGVKIYPEHWNIKRQKAYISMRLTEIDNINNTIVNNKLTELRARFIDFKHYLCEHPDMSGESISILRNYIYKGTMGREQKQSQPATLIMKQIINAKEAGESTKRQQNLNVGKFERFLKNNNISNSWKSMNLETFNHYQQYLIKENNSPTTIKNIIKDTLFALLKRADKRVDIPFRWLDSNLNSFELTKNKSNKELADNKKVALTEKQVMQIYACKINAKTLIQRNRLNEVKDLFVLQCLVGQRISDMPKFFNDESEIDEEHNTIALTQQKTGSRDIIPLMPLAKEIISKYKNKEIKYYRDDNSAVNGYLKEVAKQAGLNESITFEEKGVKQTKPLHSLIHTHTARHTFITIMCRKNISKEVLIIATGHEDTKLIDKVYLHLSAKDKAKKVAEAFNEANKTEEQSSTVLVPPINNLESLKMFIQNLEEELKGFNNIKQKRESSEESKSSKFFDILFYKRLTELALNIKTAKSRGIKLDKSTDTIYSQLIDSINKGVETKDIMYHEASLKYESVAKDRDKLISLVRGWLELGISMDTISKYIYRASNYGIDTDGFDIIISRTLEYIVTD